MQGATIGLEWVRLPCRQPTSELANTVQGPGNQHRRLLLAVDDWGFGGGGGGGCLEGKARIS